MTSFYLKNITFRMMVIFFLLHCLMCIKIKDNNNNKGTTLSVSKEVSPPQETNGLIKLFQSISAIFISGLFDRSFFVTALLAIKYSKCLVIVAAVLALSTVGVFSVFLGITINKYIDVIWIDFFSSFLFIMFGIKMIVEGLQMDKSENITESDVPTYVQFSNEERIVEVKPDKEVELPQTIKPSDFMYSVQVFCNIFIFVFASEIGDRSQISTIYLTSTFDKITVLMSVVIGQFLITILAVFGGIFISQKVSTKNLTIIAGSTFIMFGVGVLVMMCYDANFLTYFNPKASPINHTDDIKSLIPKNATDLIPEKIKK